MMMIVGVADPMALVVAVEMHIVGLVAGISMSGATAIQI
jgi:hypothetical protein